MHLAESDLSEWTNYMLGHADTYEGARQYEKAAAIRSELQDFCGLTPIELQAASKNAPILDKRSF